MSKKPAARLRPFYSPVAEIARHSTGARAGAQVCFLYSRGWWHKPLLIASLLLQSLYLGLQVIDAAIDLCAEGVKFGR